MGFLAILLATHCPPALVKRADGLCYYNTPYLSTTESGLRKPLTVKKNGFSPGVIDLGRRLFFEKALSGSGTLSCASCHQPDKGFGDGLARSVGSGGKRLRRSAPSLWNVAFYENYFWEGRVRTLEEQIRGPLFSPDEMGSTAPQIEATLNARPEYRALFSEAFGSKFDGRITFDLVVEALVTFERSLVSLRSRYDRYVFGENAALNAREIRGFHLFRSFVTRCTECHEPPLFTNFQMARIGAPDTLTEKDPGLFGITGKKGHERVFRVPSLRNVAETAPYMHSGVFSNLGELIAFYNRGGGRYDSEYNSPAVHWHIAKMGLSATEERDLAAFLASLSDSSGWIARQGETIE